MDHLWTEQRSTTVVHFGVEYGSADSQGLYDIRQRLTQIAAEVDPPQLILDFSNTDYFGAGFISVLLDLYDQLQRRDGRIAICGLPTHLRAELANVKLDRLWPIFASRDEALAAMPVRIEPDEYAKPAEQKDSQDLGDTPPRRQEVLAD